MSVLEIHLLGAPILRQETEPVQEVTPELRQLVADMFETMYAANGIGLAAPQVGRTERVAVVDVDGDRLVLINPELTAPDGSAKGEEGCLSIPEIYGDVERPERITVRALGLDGTPYERTADGLLARCIQHEVDHLHGRLFIDYLGPVKRRTVMAKWNKLRKGDRSLTRRVDPGVVASRDPRDEAL